MRNFLFYGESLTFIVEQTDWQRGVRIALVRTQAKSESRSFLHNREVAEASEAHGWQVRGSFLKAVCQRKVLTR